ncbi:cytochrome P450 [Tanacetum coccineum]|uniref:Cytochrome P450 n=1 Tax=Tanacetum coccineum TaxID=301880 RepID=A0ABQ4XES6_9ASTR
MDSQKSLRKKRNLPPSPFPCLPILGHLYLVKSPLHRVLSKLSRRHGPMLMLQFGNRRVFLVSSSAVVEECLTTNDIAFANRPHLLAGKHFGYDYTALSCGKRYYGDSGADVDETRRFQEIVKETCVLMETTNLSDYLPWWKWVGGRSLEKQMVALKEKRHEFMQSLLQEQKRKIVKDGNLAGENIKKEQNFIEVLLKLQVTEPEYYKDDVIKGLMQVRLIDNFDY